MLMSAVAALVLFAAPEATQSGEAPAAQAPAAAAAEAKPAMRRVCYEVEVSGSRLPKKNCKMEPVKTAPKATEEASAKTAATKAE
jgi:hypothetical protein